MPLSSIDNKGPEDRIILHMRKGKNQCPQVNITQLRKASQSEVITDVLQSPKAPSVLLT